MTTPTLLQPYITPKKPLKFRPDGSFKICCFSDLHQTVNYHPSTLAAIEDCAFAWCDHLVNLYLPEAPCVIAASAFKECMALGDPLQLVTLEAV